MKVNIEIAVEDDNWRKHNEINKALISKVVKEVLALHANLALIKVSEISILLTNNAKTQQLNRDFRSKNKPTNVLSFPDLDINRRNILDFKPQIDYTYLGDIAFGYDIISAEAADKNWSFNDYFIHLLIHGIMHLIGYDHQSDKEAEVMERLEISILKKFNIESPY